MATARGYAFGPFVLDGGRRTLSRDGSPILLAPKPFSLLLLLVRNSGQILSKERLLKELWTDTVGTEANLSVNIATVRRALGEKPNDHRYIVTTPQRGYSFVAEVRRLSDAELARTAGRDPGPETTDGLPRRLAVLEFDKSSRTPLEDGFGSGFAGAISAQISSLRGWSVQSRDTVRQLANPPADPVAAGRALKADAVLAGRIDVDGGRATVEVRLLDTASGALIWGDMFGEAREALSRLPRQIAASLATSLEPRTAPGDPDTQPTPPAPVQASFDEYIKGRFLLNRSDPEAVFASLDHFRRAQEQDPAFALAFAGAAEATYHLWRLALIPSEDAVPAIESAARRAQDLDPGLAEPYFWIAYLNMAHHWNWPAARTLFDLGLRRCPNSCLGRTLHAYLLLLAGKEQEALTEARRAVSLEPLNLLANATVGNIMRLTGRAEPALAQFEALLDMAPDYAWGCFLHGWTLLQAGRYEAARDKFETIHRRTGDMPYALACLCAAEAGLGRRAEAEACHRRLMDLAGRTPTEPYVVALSHLGLGEMENAIASLQKAFRERNPVMTYLRLEPCWEPVRDDPRVREIIDRIGAPAV